MRGDFSRIRIWIGMGYIFINGFDWFFISSIIIMADHLTFINIFFCIFTASKKTSIFQILRQRLAPITENFRAGASETELVKRIGRNGDRDSNPETLQSHEIVISKIRLKRILR